jgi:hypothetical protein
VGGGGGAVRTRHWILNDVPDAIFVTEWNELKE